MSSTYSTNLALELIGTGDQAGNWGATTNVNLGTLIEQAISGYTTQAITDGADTTITIPNGATGVARNMFIECTGTLTAARNLIVPANKKLYFIYNNTTGGYAVTVKVSGQTGVSVPSGAKIILVSNGTDIVVAENYLVSATLSNATLSSPTLTGTPVAPTAATGTNNTQIATTAFVNAATGTLGTMSTQNANSVSITGGSISGLSSLSVSGTTTATSFSGAGTGLTGTATSLNIGGNAATATTASNGGVTSVNGSTGAVTVGALGVSQSLGDYTGSRSLNTTYTNSTGKPIVFYVAMGYGDCDLVMSGIAVTHSQANGSGNCVVPPGATYSANAAAGRYFNYWYEYR